MRLLITLRKKSESASEEKWRVVSATRKASKTWDFTMNATEARRSRPIDDWGPTAYSAVLIIVWHCEKWNKKERYRVEDWANARHELTRLQNEVDRLKEKVSNFAKEIGA